MKKLLFICLISMAALSSKSQNYTASAGIRLGPNSAAITSGFTGKYFLNEKTAVEGILGINDGVGICGLYEIHFPIESVKNLQWFAGPGAYVAFRNSTTGVGAAGIIGLDYKFDELPLNLTIDWKPELNLISQVGFESSGIGISVRYVFK
jgi:hypothetical protein